MTDYLIETPDGEPRAFAVDGELDDPLMSYARIFRPALPRVVRDTGREWVELTEDEITARLGIALARHTCRRDTVLGTYCTLCGDQMPKRPPEARIAEHLEPRL